MRLKKLMSLVLACAMMLSLATVASAADTKVYFAEDFNGYNDIVALGATMYDTGIRNAPACEPGAGATNLNTYYNSLAVKAPVAAYAYGTYGGDSFTNTSWSAIETNDFGNKTLTMYTKENADNKMYNAVNVAYNNINQANYIVQFEPWDYEAKTDETFVISYEIESNPSVLPKALTYQRYTIKIWQSDDGASVKTQQNHDGGTTASAETDPAEGEEPDSAYTGKNYSSENVVQNFEASSTKWNSGGYNLVMEHGKTYRITHAVKYKEGQAWPTRIDVLDGAAYAGKAEALNNNNNDTISFGSTGSQDGYTKLTGYSFGATVKDCLSYGNIKMYSIKNDSFAAVIEDNTNVPLNTKSIRVKFTNPVAPTSWSNAVVVKKGGVEMEADQYSVGTLEHFIGDVNGEAYSYVDVTFANLEEGTTYTIDFADTITNEIVNQLGEEKSVATFSTKAPDVKLMPLSIVGAESLVADDDNIQAVKANLVNNTAASKNVALIYAVYTSAGQLSDVVYVNETVEETAEFEVGLKLSAAGTLKAFAWDNMTAIKPYTGSQVLTIAAPAVAE